MAADWNALSPSYQQSGNTNLCVTGRTEKQHDLLEPLVEIRGFRIGFRIATLPTKCAVCHITSPCSVSKYSLSNTSSLVHTTGRPWSNPCLLAHSSRGLASSSRAWQMLDCVLPVYVSDTRRPSTWSVIWPNVHRVS